ncbi:MAG: class I SAM-dependent methyltransferase, partial [Stellaceae bacterium]
YVDRLIQRYAPGAHSVLDLGCGTGRHAIGFAERGYSVLGIDRSRNMLNQAHARKEQLSPYLRDRLAFEHQDIRQLLLDRRFDCVLALFHVVSYQNSNQDVLAAFTTAKTHLRRDGIFVFDCWYGPGVLTDPPVAREKRLQQGAQRLLRKAEPIIHINANLVAVQIRFVSDGGAAHDPSEFCETHTMRYFFAPELALALQMTGFKIVALMEWMTDREPDRGTWSVLVVAQSMA